MNTTDLTRFAFSTTYPVCQDAVREAMLELAGRKPKPATGKPVAPKPYVPSSRRLEASHKEVLHLLATRGPMDKATLLENMTTKAPRIGRTCLRLRDRGCIVSVALAAHKAYVWKITPVGRKALASGVAPPLPVTSRFSRAKKQGGKSS